MRFFDWIRENRDWSWSAPSEFTLNPDSLRGSSRIPFETFTQLLDPRALPHLTHVSALARDLTRSRFGRVLQFYVPLYLSNECQSACVYCGFSKHRTIRRDTLDAKRMRENFALLKGRGFDSILLLTGEDRERAGVDYLEKAVALAREYFTFVALEVFPMSTDDYRRMVASGADGLTIYQETYDPKVYARWHHAGEKADYRYRLDAPERALEAGFRRIGLGVLLGLADWRTDLSRLARHMLHLQKEYWRSEFTVSFPRINPEGMLSRVPGQVSDRDLVQAITAMRLLLPEAGLVLSTREAPSLRDNLLDIGITQISAESRTNPGGYTGGHADAQFTVHDTRSLETILAVARSKGLDPVFHDWAAEFNSAPPAAQTLAPGHRS